MADYKLENISEAEIAQMISDTSRLAAEEKAETLSKITAGLSGLKAAEYADGIDRAIREANSEMMRVIRTQSGAANMCPNLDGYIAEQAHANSFNINAATKGLKGYHAEVPKAGLLQKNSVDVFIRDPAGHAARRFQAKFGATAKDTIRMINEGGKYPGQRLIVPEEQVEEVRKAFPDRDVSSVIKSPDGKVSSNPLTKSGAKSMQNNAQSGGALKQTWKNAVDKQVFAKNIAMGAGKAGAIGCVIGMSVESVASYKKWKKGEITGKEYLKEIGKAGGDSGLTAVGTYAVMVQVEAALATAELSTAFVTVPVAFVVGSALNKIIAPAFGRGAYKKILNDAKYYQSLDAAYGDLSVAMERSADEYADFVQGMAQQQKTYNALQRESMEINKELKDIYDSI